MVSLMTLLLVVDILSNNVFAQFLHDRTLYEVVNQTAGLNKTPQIDVDGSPRTIVADEDDVYEPMSPVNNVYVANSESNTVSVISIENNTKIKDIPVGDWPRAMAIEGIG